MNTVAATRRMAPPPSKPKFPWHVLPAIIVVYACMMPREFTVEIASIAFAPFRAALVLMMPIILFNAARGGFKPSPVDFLPFFIVFWGFLAILMTMNLDLALVNGLSEGLNVLLSYFVGRVSLRSSRDFRVFLTTLIPALVACAVLMAAESILHQNLLRGPLSNLLGAGSQFYIETRMGLMRANGPFPHPILAGVFMGSFLPLIYYVIQRPMWRVLGFVGVAGFFFALSSTGFLCVIVATGLIIINFIQRITKFPAFLAATIGAISAGIAIETISESGLFSFIIRRMTFSAGSGYWRMLIWEYAGAEVKRYPLFGIGLRSYTRPRWMVSDSIDTHWLLMAVRYGLPYAIALFSILMFGAIFALRGAWSPYALDRRVAYGIGFALIGILFTGFSVSLWEGVGVWMVLLAGMGITYGQVMLAPVRAAAPRQPRRRAPPPPRPAAVPPRHPLPEPA